MRCGRELVVQAARLQVQPRRLHHKPGLFHIPT